MFFNHILLFAGFRSISSALTCSIAVRLNLKCLEQCRKKLTSHISSWHHVPMNGLSSVAWQSHIYHPRRSSHLAPLRHWWFTQSSISVSHRGPTIKISRNFHSEMNLRIAALPQIIKQATGKNHVKEHNTGNNGSNSRTCVTISANATIAIACSPVLAQAILTDISVIVLRAVTF